MRNSFVDEQRRDQGVVPETGIHNLLAPENI